MSAPSSQALGDCRGIGPERAAQLARLGLHTTADLLLLRPRRYEDRRNCKRIADLALGEATCAHGVVQALGVKWWNHHRKSVFELILDDGSGRLRCRWWNMPYLERRFQTGEELFVYGKVQSLKPRIIDHPETESVDSGDESAIHLNRIVPIYPLTEGLPQRWLRSLIWRWLAEESLPLNKAIHHVPLRHLPDRAQAVRWLHRPETIDQVEQARRRLAFDEFLALQMSLQQRRQKLWAHARAPICSGDNRLIRPFLSTLGFHLTGSQTDVLREIRRDIAVGRPMRRLLQGDVGSGKTVVAACAALMILESGHNVVLMAPTQTLAEQHDRLFARWFGPLGISTALLTGDQKSYRLPAGHPEVAAPSRPAREPQGRRIWPSNAEIGANPSLVVGTHALIESPLVIPNLGLVIIDEQHRFGVLQREELVRKGDHPHLLVMSATPIPRSLGLTIYGDLDVSTLREFPAGRGRVKTFLRNPEALPKVWTFIREQLDAGRQAYVVYPLVEESERARELKAVTRQFELISRSLAPFPCGLLHGRLGKEERAAGMAAFRSGALRVLVTTTVIEVGIDIPNATVMLIENADRFGLAQLHQLRGRISRSPHPAYCILVAEAKTDEARRRLDLLTQTQDGFRIAEADLALRGPGELLGRSQSGLPGFKFASLSNDLDLLETARAAAQKAVGLATPP